MIIVDHTIKCKSRSDRIEIFPFFDCHVGKRNCAEHAIHKQVLEIVRRSKMSNRHVRVLFGGDQLNAVNPVDIRRFDFNELADWFVDGDAKTTRDKLNDVCSQEIKRFVEMFHPIKHLIIGMLAGNHEKAMRTKQNVNVHSALCTKMEVPDLTDEAFIRFKFIRQGGGGTTVVKLYLRHGYGAGRTPGAEPNKLARMRDEWEDADVCLSGHSHSYDILPPKPVLYIPNKGKYSSKQFQYRYRFAANPGSWLLSHLPGPSSYESMSAYAAKPMMTLKIVIWPFWHTNLREGGERITVQRPKIELREYPIL